MASTLPTTTAVMRAVLKTGPGEGAVEVSTVPVPQTVPGTARVRVVATGICGTDVHIARDEYASEPPVVMGHEITGVVDEVGSGEDQHWVGTRVALETYFSACERCAWCRAGRRNLCPARRSIGSYEHGGFAEYVVVPVLNLHALPAWLGEHEGALCEPLACVAQCLMDPPAVQPGDRVLVTGPGAMGQLCAQVALAHGGVVTLAGLPQDSDRLAVAAALGIETTTEAAEAGAYDVVIEASGAAPAAAMALRAARRGGRYVQVGIFGAPVTVDLDQVLYKELVMTSGFASTATSWASAVRLLEDRRVTLAPLVTQRFALTDFHAALASAQRGEGLKTVVVP